MGLLDKILGNKDPGKEKVLQGGGHTFKFISGYDPVFTTWHGQIYESELVRASIDARSRHISKLRVEFKGTAKPDLTAKLRRQPNPWQTWSQFLYRVNTILDIKNNCIIIPIYDDDLNKIGIFPVIPDQVKVQLYKDELWLTYKYMTGRYTGACRLIEAAILTKFQYESDLFGSSNNALDDTMKLITVQNQGIQNAVKNSAVYRFMARMSNFSQYEDLEEERANFSARNFSSEAKNGGLLLFPNIYEDVKQIDSKPYTIDDKQMQIIKDNVFSYFGVNEDILQNKSIGDAWAAFYEGAVEPFAVQFSETLTRALYSERERAAGAEVILTANRLQYMSNKDKMEVSAQMADRGIMTVNEIRDIWNLAPFDWGDVPVIRGEYYQLGDDDDTGADPGDNNENGGAEDGTQD